MWNEKFYHRAALAVLGLVAVIILFTFQDYGITWDEEVQSQYGLAIVDYYLSGFHDQRYDQLYNLYLYGGMFDGLASMLDRFTPFTVYTTRHLLNALFGLIGLWGTWRLGRLIGGGAVGLVALVLLALTPVYYGHMFNNPKDIPFAAGVVWTLYYMGRCLVTADRPRWKLILKTGVIFGLTLGVRVGGAMIFAFWLAPLFFLAIKPFLNSRSRWREALLNLWHCGWRMVAPVFALAYLVMLACWPWAQQHPVMNPLHALGVFKNFPNAVEVLLDGTTYMSTELPWYYVPVYFDVQLPELLLFFLFCFFVSLPWIVRGLAGLSKKYTLILIMLTAFMPMLYAMARQPPLYDAVRHFLFTVPLMCIMAALAARQLGEWCYVLVNRAPSRLLRAVLTFEAIIAVTIFLALQITQMILLHPYEYIYVNQFAGGVPGAFGKYELDYWGSSFKEAAGKIQDYVNAHGGVPPGKIFTIAICGPWDSAMIYLPPDYEAVLASEPADFFLSTTRWMCQGMRPGKEILRVERMGVPLAIVKDVRGEP